MKDKGRKQVEKLTSRLETLTVEYFDVEALKPNPWNPNRQSDHEAELLRRSMAEDGFTQPVLAVTLTKADLTEDAFKGKGYAEGDVVIVDGEHRWRTAAELGFSEIPVVRTSMSAVQARISTIRHNKARGSHDIGLEADLLRDLQVLGAIDWAQDSLMLDDVELNRLLNDTPATEALAGDEWSQAWNPVSGEDGQGESPTDHQTTSMTPAAVAARREAERRLEEAETEDEREQVRRDLRLYRVSLSFFGDEAETVRAALGDHPAERVLELCRGAVGAEA